MKHVHYRKVKLQLTHHAKFHGEHGDIITELVMGQPISKSVIH